MMTRTEDDVVTKQGFDKVMKKSFFCNCELHRVHAHMEPAGCAQGISE